MIGESNSIKNYKCSVKVLEACEDNKNLFVSNKKKINCNKNMIPQELSKDNNFHQASKQGTECSNSKASSSHQDCAGISCESSYSSWPENSLSVCPLIPSSPDKRIVGSRRKRRKCSVPDCPNRVVQGGVCISHGAKRRKCDFPGCTKNVKRLGRCSTHGPPRMRCKVPGCNKTAIQFQRCTACSSQDA